MQDSLAHLNSLKTMFMEMRVGITKFQRYYLEIYSCLDYLEIHKPRMDGGRPPAKSNVNCIGTITNIPCIVQDFYTAGLPVWFLRHSSAWDSPMRCNILEVVTPLDPANVICVSDHCPPFPAIFHGPSTDPKDIPHFWSFTNVVGIPRPIWGFEGLVDPTLTHHISHFFQRIIIFNYISFIQSNCFIQSSHWSWHFSFWTEISSSTLYVYYSFILICYISSQFF